MKSIPLFLLIAAAASISGSAFAQDAGIPDTEETAAEHAAAMSKKLGREITVRNSEAEVAQKREFSSYNPKYAVKPELRVQRFTFGGELTLEAAKALQDSKALTASKPVMVKLETAKATAFTQYLQKAGKLQIKKLPSQQGGAQ